MKRILLRAPKSPFEVVAPEEVLARNLVGTNSGNLIFLEAAWKLLDTREATVSADGMRARPGQADAINERFDAYVVPLANAFRLSYETNLIRMTELIRRLRIPVVILGVGAQLNVNGDPERLRPIERTVRAFVEAVLDRSGTIGVRGEMTAAYLEGLGYRDVEVIGCPSMFLHGPDLRVTRRLPRLEPDARLSIALSPYVKIMGEVVRRHLERYPNLTYVAQDLHTLQLLLWGDDGSATPDTNLPVHTKHPLFVQGKVRYYVDPWPWLRDLAQADFSFGTRIHGNIAAILAGTPAYVLAHDSRTLELARYFGIPHRPLPEVTPDIDAADLYAEADFSRLNDGQAERFARFRDYLSRNGLRDVFADGEDPTAFDRRIEATPFPPAVDGASARRPLSSLRRRLQYRVGRLVRATPVRAIHGSLVRRLARPGPRS